MINVNGTCIYSEDTARDFLHGMGMDNMDVEEFARMLCEDEIEEAEHKADVANQEFQAMEAYTDHVQSVINEVLNIVDEALNMERISKPRERFEAIKQLIYNEL